MVDHHHAGVFKGDALFFAAGQGGLFVAEITRTGRAYTE
jgi:hypothetical protein